MEAKKKNTEISRRKEKNMPVEKKAVASAPKNVESKKPVKETESVEKTAPVVVTDAKPAKEERVKKAEKTVVPATQAEKKPVAKKTATKASTAEKKPTTKAIASAFVEFAGNQINILEVIESAKAHYKALYEKENGVIKDISVYVKPDENVAYYVVNGVGSDNYKVGI